MRCGGGVNHRMALRDAALVKDNHVLAAGGVAEAFAAVRALEATIPVEIEVDSLDGLREAIDGRRRPRAARQLRRSPRCARRSASATSRAARSCSRRAAG